MTMTASTYFLGMDSRWFIAVGRPVRNEMINEIPTMYAKDNEFVTQFDLLGNICFNDHRSVHNEKKYAFIM